MVLEIPVYKTANNVHYNPAIAEEVLTHCASGIANKISEVLIRWDAINNEWVEDPVFVSGESVAALKIYDPCDETTIYANYPFNDFRIAQQCCVSNPLFRYSVNASGENMEHQFRFVQGNGDNSGKVITISWGDGSGLEEVEIVDENDLDITHVYTTPGIYEIKIYVQGDVVKEYSVLSGVLTGTFRASKGNVNMTDLNLQNQNGVTSVPNSDFNDVNLGGTGITSYRITQNNKDVFLTDCADLEAITVDPGSDLVSLFCDNCVSLNDGGLNFLNGSNWGVQPQALSFNNCPLISALGFDAGFADVTNMKTLRVGNTNFGQDEVNAALVALAGDDETGGTFNSVGTFAPSGAGATAKTTLQGRGWTVNTD